MYRQIHLMGSGDEVIVLSPAGIYYYSLDMGSITAAKFEVIDTACIVCGRVYVTVRLSARLSVPSVDSCSSVRHVCCRTWTREQEISIDSAQQHGGQQQLRALSRCQLTYEAGRRLVLQRITERARTVATRVVCDCTAALSVTQ